MKIAIIGYSGAGKSTLAEKLSLYYSIPKLHMDTLQFQPGWQDSDQEWMLTEMKSFLTKHEAWITDGNYSWCYYEERMREADQIIFLNFSPLTCLFEPLNGTSNTEARSEKVWQLVVKNNLIGSLSDGFSGMGGANPLRSAISGFKKPIQIKWSSLGLKKR